jgi:hypothetical protein
MKIDILNRISVDQVKDVPTWFREHVLIPLNQALEQIVRNLRGGLTFRDNFLCQVEELEFTHGVSRQILNKMGRPRPIGGIGLHAEGESITAVSVDPRTTNSKFDVTVYFQSGSGTATCRIIIFGE